MPQLTLSTGFDVNYYLDQVGADYYLTAAGEPPGVWMGTAAEAMGLRGEVDPDVMRALYHEGVAPDGTRIAARPQCKTGTARISASVQRAQDRIDAAVAELGRFATPEEIRAITHREMTKVRHSVPFYDFTLSVEKSVSLLWAGYRAEAYRARTEHREADAERAEAMASAIEQALMETAAEHVRMLEKFAIVRTGHHSATSGQWRDARGLVVVPFLQHDNREHEPNLHVQMVVLNRAQRADGADDKWRALDGGPFWAERLGLAALDSVIFAQKLTDLGIPLVQQASGNGTDVGGVTQETMDAFSSRTAKIEAKLAAALAEYEQEHGHAPARRELFEMRKRITLATRKTKAPGAPPEQQTEQERAEAARQVLADWMAKAEAEQVQALESLPGTVAAYDAEHGPGSLPSGSERARIIRIAVAEVQRQNPAWTRAKLLWELKRALLTVFPAGTDAQAYLEGLADEALGGPAPESAPEDDPDQPGPAGADVPEIIQIAPVSDVVDTSTLDHRRDGTSVYRRSGEARYVTKPHLNAEEWLLRTAAKRVAQRVTEAQAEQAVAALELDYHQRAAVAGMLASTRFVECLVAPAGTGKTRIMAAFARAWISLTGCRVIGLTTSENAARVLAGEGMTECYNVAQFLGRIKDSDRTRGHVPVYAGDVLVIDEASQMSTADQVSIRAIAEKCGAQLKMVGDTEQLGGVEAGGIFRLTAAEHGHWNLYDVRRFTRAWERDASLQLRKGDVMALAEYHARGHVKHGAQDRMHDEAVDAWFADFTHGRPALLLAGTNAEAAQLARLARERLAEHGKISGADEITLADGNAAGVGDLVRARLNTKIDVDGQTLSNRDTLKITGWAGAGKSRVAAAVRVAADGAESSAFLLPASYLEENAELAYAGNVYVAQGRTVDRGHLVVTPAMSREQLYVGATRGREENTMYVPTGPAEPGAMTRQERFEYSRERVLEAIALMDAGDNEAAMAVNLVPPDEPLRERAPWQAIVAGVMAKDDPELTAIEQMRAAQDLVSDIGHLIEVTEAFWWRDVVPQIDAQVQARISPREYERYLSDPERPAFLQLLRTYEIGGRSIGESLDRITGRSFKGARSIAGVLHGRLEKDQPPGRGKTETFAERVPVGAAPEISEGYQAADARQAEIGRQLAEHPEEWAIRAWGQPPAEAGALRDDWERRAGLVGAYRRAAGITDPQVAIGPVPTGQAVTRELFHASVRALELSDEKAMLAAMGRGDLEARVREYERAAAQAPPEVTAELESVKSQRAEAEHQAGAAVEAGNDVVARGAGNLRAMADAQLAELTVADAARKEWAEANAETITAGKTAAAELRARALAEPIPVTDSEVAAAAAQPRDYPAPDPAEATQWRAEQTARIEADRQAGAEAMARAIPVTDAELARYGAQALADDPVTARMDADLAEIRQGVDEIHAAVDAMPDAEARREAERAAYVAEPGPRAQAEAQAAIEPAWTSGAGRDHAEPEREAAPQADFEAEL
jgi:conjugative relaxase-like TrwC/TraI family protein